MSKDVLELVRDNGVVEFIQLVQGKGLINLGPGYDQ